MYVKAHCELCRLAWCKFDNIIIIISKKEEGGGGSKDPKRGVCKIIFE